MEIKPITITDEGTGSPFRRHPMCSNTAEAEIYLAKRIPRSRPNWLERTGIDATTRRRATGIGLSIYRRAEGRASTTRLSTRGIGSIARLLLEETGTTIRSLRIGVE